jgi:predicted metalloprotease with PDZ domain
MRVKKDFLLARLAEKKPGDVVKLTVFREDNLKVLEIKLGPRDAAKYRILPAAAATEEQKKIYQSWIGVGK